MKRILIGLLAAAAAAPAMAQEAASQGEAVSEAVGEAEQAGAGELDEEDEAEDIVVTGQRERGAVLGDIEPELQLNRGDIRAYGASTLAELLDAIAPQTRSGRGRGGERPVVLVNGRRVSGFREIRGIPPEAIVRVDILPEEVALKYGYRADQRVVNFVLRRRFRAVTAEIEQGAAAGGERGESKADLNILRITRDGRWNVDAEYNRTTPLLESERQLGGDAGRFRTLLPGADQYSLQGTYNRSIMGGIAATANASFEGSSSESRLGFAEGDAIELRPLTRDGDSRTGHVGFAFNGALDPWQWSLTANYDRGSVRTLTDRGGADRDRSLAVNDIASAELVANGPLFELPAGSVQVSLKAGSETRGFRSEATRAGVLTEGELSRRIGDVQASVDVPVADKGGGVLAGIGDLSANFNVALQQLSDFGVLRTLGGGFNWSPIDEVDLIASVTDEDGAPSMQQLGDPLVVTPNVQVFDFTRGETAEVDRIEGGNRLLIADNRRVWKLGATVRPLEESELTLSANYTNSSIRDAISAFPAVTPEIEAAFPERFLRSGEGRLLRIDTRPVNFAKVERQELRWGLNFTKPLESSAPPGGFGGGRRRERARGEAGERGEGMAREGAQARPEGARGFGGRGFGGRGFGGGRRGGRLQFSLYHIWRLEDSILIRQGVPELDLLAGSAAGSRGGTPRHALEAELGWFRNGLGARLTADWQSGTNVEAQPGESGGGEGGLRFSSLATANLRLFANLGEQRSLVRAHPWLRGTRVSLEVDNLFNGRPRVTDAAGLTPLGYQPGYLDPLGRAIQVSFRKLFF